MLASLEIADEFCSAPRRRIRRAKPGSKDCAGEEDCRLTQIVTANRLTDGIVVFQDDDRRLERRFCARPPLDDATAALARAGEDVAASLVVDPYAIEVVLRNGHYAPKALREAIRAAGPTVRPDLGKQAEGLAPLHAAHAPTGTRHVSL